MPRDGSGNYSLPAGNPVVSNETISSTWANSTLEDLKNAVTDSLDRQGRGGMLAPFKFVDGTVGAPGMTFTSEPSSGFYRAAAGDVRWALGGVDVARVLAGGFQFFRASAWRSPLDVAQDAAITGAWTFGGASVRSADLINAGTFGVDRIPVLTEGKIPSLDAGKITTGEFAAARIPTLDAAKIGSGTFADARIPNLAASKVTSGTFDAARIPTLDAAKIGTGTLPTARGGTGLTGFTAGSFFYASSTSVIAQRTPAQVLSDIGAAAASHTHSYLALSGGTLTGTLTARQVYIQSGYTLELGHSSDTSISRLAAAKVGVEGKALIKHTGSYTSGEVTVSTSAPSGGSDGDIWLRY